MITHRFPSFLTRHTWRLGASRPEPVAELGEQTVTLVSHIVICVPTEAMICSFLVERYGLPARPSEPAGAGTARHGRRRHRSALGPDRTSFWGHVFSALARESEVFILSSGDIEGGRVRGVFRDGEQALIAAASLARREWSESVRRGRPCFKRHMREARLKAGEDPLPRARLNRIKPKGTCIGGYEEDDGLNGWWIVARWRVAGGPSARPRAFLEDRPYPVKPGQLLDAHEVPSGVLARDGEGDYWVRFGRWGHMAFAPSECESRPVRPWCGWDTRRRTWWGDVSGPLEVVATGLTEATATGEHMHELAAAFEHRHGAPGFGGFGVVVAGAAVVQETRALTIVDADQQPWEPLAMGEFELGQECYARWKLAFETDHPGVVAPSWMDLSDPVRDRWIEVVRPLAARLEAAARLERQSGRITEELQRLRASRDLADARLGELDSLVGETTEAMIEAAISTTLPPVLGLAVSKLQNALREAYKVVASPPSAAELR